MQIGARRRRPTLVHTGHSQGSEVSAHTDTSRCPGLGPSAANASAAFHGSSSLLLEPRSSGDDEKS